MKKIIFIFGQKTTNSFHISIVTIKNSHNGKQARGVRDVLQWFEPPNGISRQKVPGIESCLHLQFSFLLMHIPGNGK